MPCQFRGAQSLWYTQGDQLQDVYEGAVGPAAFDAAAAAAARHQAASHDKRTGAHVHETWQQINECGKPFPQIGNRPRLMQAMLQPHC